MTHLIGRYVAIILAMTLTLQASPALAGAPAKSVAKSVALGAYISGAPWHPERIDDYQRIVGRHPAIVMWYQDWATPGVREFSADRMQAVVDHGSMPVLTWEPWDARGGVHQPAFSLATILAGDHDRFLREWARAAKAWGQPFYLRFAPEMNGTWFSWSPGVNGNAIGEFPAAWRHVVSVFRAEDATNVRWVWSPNVSFDGSTPMASLYPGDAWVDWVGLDGYNWGTSFTDKRWLTPLEIFADSYTELTALTQRPLMIAETASAEAGGNKAAWIDRGLRELVTALPRVRAVIWFHENKETDWRIDSSSKARNAYRRLARDGAFSGRLP